MTYENPGAMNLSQARADGCTPAALRGILSCIYEFITLLEREYQEKASGDVKQQARMMTVVDMGGLSVGNLNKDTFAFMLTAAEIMDSFYPNVRTVYSENHIFCANIRPFPRWYPELCFG